MDPKQDKNTVEKIIQDYKNHPSLKKIKNNLNSKPFDFPELNTIIKSLDPKKATGPDGIPIKIIKHGLNIIDSHFCKIIKKDLSKNKYSEEPKTALVRPIFKKNERNKLENYRPVSILSGMSKIYELQLSLFLCRIFSIKIRSYQHTESPIVQIMFC